VIYDLQHRQVALLVIDVQGEYFDEDGPAYVEHARDIVGNVNRLIDLFRAEDLPIVFVKHLHRADGSDAGRMGDFSAPGEEDAWWSSAATAPSWGPIWRPCCTRPARGPW
jgi:nicotinamidase-related amidase